MGYTALDQMRKVNRQRFGMDVGPSSPKLIRGGKTGQDLKSAALRFLHERCEGLRFDPEKEAKEKETGKYLGTSIVAGQIPWNMQKDIDRLCLEHELEVFIDSGVAEDAYTVYYAWMEMFMGEFGRSQKMVELLSEFESNASSLLMKHRDHYSHSVYVFTLGLAIYETHEEYRNTFNRFYGFTEESDNHRAAHFFLAYWGLTSLFHDIGYPFEIPFEQVLAYFEVDQKKRGPGSVYIAYRDIDYLTAMDETATAHFQKLTGRSFSSVPELLAYGIEKRLGKAYGVSEEYLQETIETKPTHPEQFGYFMDHAFFSASRLYQELNAVLGTERLTEAHLDALTAIMLHNSMYKFAIAFYKDPDKRKAPLKASLHPLAYLLMLCDELQCWDRIAYGRNSRTELHPMCAEFDFSGGGISAVYGYDEEERSKIEAFESEYAEWEKNGENGKAPRLKAYSDMAEKEQRFRTDIEKIVDLTGIPFTVKAVIRKPDRSAKHIYISVSSFLHLYDFAVALNARYTYMGKEADIKTEKLEAEFDSMSLEYKLSNINQAKYFARYLNVIGCFYTDRLVDYPMLKRFNTEQINRFAPLEHERWVIEHKAMGWRYGTLYEKAEKDPAARKALREQLRQNKCCMDSWRSEYEIYRHYDQLPLEMQAKDWRPFNSMLKLIRKFDGLRIYIL